jgi:hypothetical protein
VTLVVSHTVADGVGMAIAVTDAAQGTTKNLGYPAGGLRTKKQALLDDSRVIARTLPQIPGAMAAAVRIAVTNACLVLSGPVWA